MKHKIVIFQGTPAMTILSHQQIYERQTLKVPVSAPITPRQLATATSDCLQSWSSRHVSKRSGGGADHPTTPAAMLTAKNDLLLFQYNWPAASQPNYN